jgi:HlyD family secretion protein
MKQRIRIVIPVLVLGAAVAWYFTRGGGADAGTLSASGTVEATEAALGFQIPGRIAAIRVREGERVLAGDTLAALDLSDREAQVASAEATLAAALAQLRELEAGVRPQELRQAEAGVRAAEETLAERRLDLERTRRLHEGGAVSVQALDRARTAYDVAEAQAEQARETLALAREGPREERIAAQRSRVAQAEANLARARVSRDEGVVLAPGPGVVAIRHREPGESVGAGQPVVTIRNMDDRWVRIYVAGDRIGQVQIGQAATIRSDSHGDRTFRGEVYFIGSEAEFTPRNVQTAEERVRLVYPVKVRVVGDNEEALKPGTPADVVLDLGESG